MAEHVSAVIFSNSGTVAKFNRMGVVTGFGSDRIKMYRVGVAVDHDPGAIGPKQFEMNIRSADYTENWVEGLEVYHNPQASIPLDPSLLPGAAHIFLDDNGIIVARVPPWHPMVSRTVMTGPALDGR